MDERIENSIRMRFGPQLERLGVSLFTIYTEDLWQPGQYIPHEVDGAAFYAEALYSGIEAELAERVRSACASRHTVVSNNPPGTREFLSKAFLRARDVPKSSSGVRPQSNNGLPVRDLFASFSRREQVLSCFALTPSQPILKSPATLAELLFFNYRSEEPRLLDDSYISELIVIGNAIAEDLAADIDERKKKWVAAAVRCLRCQSRLSRALIEAPDATTGPFGSHSFSRIARQIHSELRRRDERLIVSIYERESRTPNVEIDWSDPSGSLPKLQCIGSYGKNAEGDYLGSQRILLDLSITVCTAVTGRSHLLLYVEDDSLPEGENRQPITAVEVTGSVLNAADLHKWTALLQNQGQGAPPRLYRCTHSKEVNRLILAGKLTSEGWSQLEELARSASFPTFVIPRLRQRVDVKYARIFGTLDSDWGHPCSEVCVPIIVAGQKLGCVNIESSSPDRFHPSLLNPLIAIASMVGNAILESRRRGVLEGIEEITTSLHTSESLPAAEAFQSRLDQFAAITARALGCLRLSILGRMSSPLDPLYHLAMSDPNWHRGMTHDTRLLGRNWNDERLRACLTGAEGLIIVPSRDIVPGDERRISAMYRFRRNESESPSIKISEDIARTVVNNAIHLEKAEIGDLALWNERVEAPRISVIIVYTLGSFVDISETLPAVMYCDFRDPPFDISSSGVLDRFSLSGSQCQGYLQMFLSVAKHCVAIPTIFRSALLLRAEDIYNFEHSPLAIDTSGILDKLENIKMSGDGESDALLKEARLAMRGHVYEQQIADKLGRLHSSTELSKFLLKQIAHVSAEEAIREYWEAAAAVSGDYTTSFVLRGKSDLRLKGLGICSSASHFIFAQLFRNSITSIRRAQTRDQQQSRQPRRGLVSVTLETVGRLQDVAKISILDNGCGFPDEILERVNRPIVKDRPSLHGKHGRGLDMFQRICNGLFVSKTNRPRAENLESGGAEWLFDVPLVDLAER